MIDKNNIGTIRFGLVDGSTLRLHAKYVTAEDSYAVADDIAAIEGKDTNDPTARPFVERILDKTVSGWDSSEPYSFAAVLKRLSCPELTTLVMFLPAASADLERARVDARGGRRYKLMPDGTPSYDFADDSDKPATVEASPKAEG